MGISGKNLVQPSMIRKWLMYFAGSLLVSITVAIVIIVILADNYSSGKRAEYDYAVASLNHNIENVLKFSYIPNATSHACKVDIKYLLCSMYEEYGVSSKCYVDDVVFADSGDCVFMLTQEKDSTKVYKILDLDCMEGYDSATGGNLYDNLSDAHKVVLREYYLINNLRLFVPIKIEAYKNDDKDNQQMIAFYSFDDVEKPSSYYVVKGGSAYNVQTLPVMVRLGDDGISSQYTLSSIYGQNMTAIMNTVNKNLDETYRTTLIMSEYVFPSYYEAHIQTVVLILMAAVLFSVLFATVGSYVRYAKEKYLYDMIEYRRKTTNAMAHDLKTPLAAISAYSENLQLEKDEEKKRYYSEKIVENVGVMNRMIEEILQFSRSEVQVSITEEEVDAAELIREIAEEVRPLFDDNSVSLRTVSDISVTLRTDRNLLKQSILNLMTNAAKYSSKETETEVVLLNNKITVTNHTELMIDDVGRLKEPFVKGHDSRGEKDGTGLGLSIADNNLNMLGYRLELEYKDGVFTAAVVF